MSDVHDSPQPQSPTVVRARWMAAEPGAESSAATLVDVLHGDMPVVVDQSGLVSPAGAGWSLDWWIGGDDRWYFPSAEAAVRQRRIGVGPVVETAMRIPSGDATATVYGARSASGAESADVAVVEIANQSPVPVALVLAVRPYAAVPLEAGGPLGLEPVDESTVVVGGQYYISLPRAPAGWASSADADLAPVVQGGRPLGGLVPVDGSEANGVVMYPLPHGTSLRVVIGRRNTAEPVRPDQVPDAERVSRGWSSVVNSGTRLSTPDSGVDQLLNSARARLLLRPADGLDEVDHVLGLDGGNASPSLLSRLTGRRHVEPSGTCDSFAGGVVAALAAGGHFEDVDRVLSHVIESPASRLSSPEAGARLIAGCSMAGSLWLAAEHDQAQPVVEAALEQLTNLTRMVERAAATGAADADLAFSGLGLLCQLLGQDDAADDLRQRIDGWAPSGDQTLRLGQVADLAVLTELGQRASEARSWPQTDNGCGPGRPTKVDGISGAASYIMATRGMLLAEDLAGGLEILPNFPAAWRGGQVEVHEAPTLYGRLSYAVRWHGPRPALLWDLAPGGPLAVGAVRLRCPALDPEWSTASLTGETLLAGTDQGLEPVPAPGDSFG